MTRDEHIGPIDPLEDGAAILRGIGIENDAAFVRIEKEERAALLGVGRVTRKGPPAPGLVARARDLELDDLGAVIREEPSAERTGNPRSQLDDADARESIPMICHVRVVEHPGAGGSGTAGQLPWNQ